MRKVIDCTICSDTGTSIPSKPHKPSPRNGMTRAQWVAMMRDQDDQNKHRGAYALEITEKQIIVGAKKKP